MIWSAIWSRLLVIGIACTPVLELKAAIPVGLANGLPLWETFIWAWVGSCLPVPLLLLFIRKVLNFLKGTKPFRRFAEWVERRALRKSGNVRKYSLLGLFIFVAVPLPTTGVWTGSLIADLLDLRMKHALPVILLGNLVAGILILMLSHYIIL